MEDGEGGPGGFWRDEGCDRCCRGETLVEEGDADQSPAEGGEQAQGGHGGRRVAGQADKGAAAGVERLGWREGDGEEGAGSADDFECRIWEIMSSKPLEADDCVYQESRRNLDYFLACQKRPTTAQLGFECIGSRQSF